MRAIVITDVHGNLPALLAVFEAIQSDNYDRIIHLGDVIGIGPYPLECLHYLLQAPGCYLIMGNHDAWFVHGLPNP